MIVCGWCGNPTANLDRCASCNHIDPARPWVHRGEEPPTVQIGKPGLDKADIRRRLAHARADLLEAHRSPTVEALAEQMGVSPRTVRRWRQLS